MHKYGYRDAMTAACAKHLLEIRILHRYRSSAAKQEVVVESSMSQLLGQGCNLYPPGHCKALYVGADSARMLDALPDEKKAAMKLLGLWPEELPETPPA